MNKKYKKWWNILRLEKRIPKRLPRRDFPLGPRMYKSKWKKRMGKWWMGYYAYREHIEEGYSKMPNSYEEFKKDIKFFYGWDFSTTCGDY